MRVLNLTLKKKWFDMIASGEKKEEYREIKPYWIKRLLCDLETEHGYTYEGASNLLKDVFGYGYTDKDLTFEFQRYHSIRFRNGYSKDAPEILIECKGIEVGNAKPEWSDNWQGNVFIIKLGDIVHEK